MVVEGSEPHVETWCDGSSTEDIVLVEEVDGDATAGINDKQGIVRGRDDSGTDSSSHAVHSYRFGSFVVEGDRKYGFICEQVKTSHNRMRDNAAEIRPIADNRGYSCIYFMYVGDIFECCFFQFVDNDKVADLSIIDDCQLGSCIAYVNNQIGHWSNVLAALSSERFRIS